MRKTILIVTFLGFIKPIFGQLYVNEIMASNVTTIVDNNGNYSDWIEIYNAGGSNIDLANYYLSDDNLNLTKFKFPNIAAQSVIPAGGTLLIWASGSITNGVNHTNFSLSSTNGEAIYLTATNGTTIIDGFTFLPQRDDVSYGRENNGSTVFKYFSPSSPNSNNNPANGYSGFLTPPTFSSTGKFFNSPFSLTLSHSEPGVFIYYTTDGSDPVGIANSPITFNYKDVYRELPSHSDGPMLNRNYYSRIYSSPIPIEDKTPVSNYTSMTSSTWYNVPYYFPNYNVQKGTIVRAIATKPGLLSSDAVTHTYFYTPTGTSNFTLPVVSVTTQENNLFDYNTGIYTAGATFDEFRLANPDTPADFCTEGNFSNKGSAWERSANFEYFLNSNQAVNQNVKFRINGGCTKSQPYKALRIYGSNNFDEFPFFSTHPTLLHRTILLRNSGNDYNQTMIKDGFVITWLGHLNYASQKLQPSILFLNGEYWGLHNVRERIDNYYLNSLYGVNSSNLDMREINFFTPDEIDEGDGIHYDNMLNFISNNDLTVSTNYNQAITLLDPENYIDYQTTEIFIGNIDWPQNNVKLWRNRVTYNPTAPYGHDGRWRWILYDTDRSLGEVVNASNNDLKNAILNADNIIFKKLLQNNTFKNSFVNRFADLYNSAFKATHATTVFNNTTAIIAPEVGKHLARWKNLADSSAWVTQCNIVRTYLNERPEEMMIQYLDTFDISGIFNITLATEDLSKGYIRINKLDLLATTPGIGANPTNWTGVYFDNIPVDIIARPRSGFKFSHWIYNGNTLADSILTIFTSVNQTYTAYFIPTVLSSNPAPATAKNLTLCSYKLTEWASNRAPGTFPDHTVIMRLNTENPDINSTIDSLTNGAYNLTSSTRATGQDSYGISFINTGGANPGYPATKLGGLIVAINTTDLDSVKINWTGRTITPNPRKYRIRLYFREGDIAPFQEFSPIVEYAGSVSVGHSQTFTNIILPNSMLNKPYVQLLWKYYDTKIVSSGPRDEIAMDDIFVEGVKLAIGLQISNNPNNNNPGYLYSSGQVINGNNVINSAEKSVTLLPGFTAQNGSIFKAEIKTCL